MTQMFKAKIKGLANEYVDGGVWLTQEDLDLVMARQYDDVMCRKAVYLGGKYFRPADFEGVIERKGLKELVKSDSPLVDAPLLESLAKSGHLGEVVEACPMGYKSFVNQLVESGQYQLTSGEPEQTPEINSDKVQKLAEMKQRLLIDKEL